jgi:hypothetical protein
MFILIGLPVVLIISLLGYYYICLNLLTSYLFIVYVGCTIIYVYVYIFISERFLSLQK